MAAKMPVPAAATPAEDPSPESVAGRQPSVGSSTRASEENDCADVPVAMDGERNETAVRVDTVRMVRLNDRLVCLLVFQCPGWAVGSVWDWDWDRGAGGLGTLTGIPSGSQLWMRTCRFHITGGVHPVMIRAA